MQDIGTLKIRFFFTLSRDEFGRETAGKWLNMLTKHCVTREDAQLIFEDVKKNNPSSMQFHAVFTIEDMLY